MGVIKKIKAIELIGGTTNDNVYPVTSTKAVYNSENISLDNIIASHEQSIENLTETVENLNLNQNDAMFSTLVNTQHGEFDEDSDFDDDFFEKVENGTIRSLKLFYTGGGFEIVPIISYYKNNNERITVLAGYYRRKFNADIYYTIQIIREPDSSIVTTITTNLNI